MIAKESGVVIIFLVQLLGSDSEIMSTCEARLTALEAHVRRMVSASWVVRWKLAYTESAGRSSTSSSRLADDRGEQCCQFPLNAIAPCSWTPEESQVESCEHQDNANIHYQPFPESVSEEHEIYTDYDGCHRHHVKHDSYLLRQTRHNISRPNLSSPVGLTR